MKKNSLLSIICAGVMAVGSSLVSASDKRNDYSVHHNEHEKKFIHNTDRVHRLNHKAERAYRKGHYGKGRYLEKKAKWVERHWGRYEDRHGHGNPRYDRHREHGNRHGKYENGNRHAYGGYASMGRRTHNARTCQDSRHRHGNRRNRNHGSQFTDNVSIWLRF